MDTNNYLKRQKWAKSLMWLYKTQRFPLIFPRSGGNPRIFNNSFYTPYTLKVFKEALHWSTTCTVPKLIEYKVPLRWALIVFDCCFKESPLYCQGWLGSITVANKTCCPQCPAFSSNDTKNLKIKVSHVLHFEVYWSMNVVSEFCCGDQCLQFLRCNVSLIYTLLV